MNANWALGNYGHFLGATKPIWWTMVTVVVK